MTEIRAVAFDLDGLMVNSEDVYLHVGVETLGRRGQEFTVELRDEMMGQPAAQSLAIMIERCGLSDTIEELVVEGESLFWHFAEEILAPMPGLKELVGGIDAAGVPRAVVTSGARDYALRLLELVDLPDFQFVLTADDITHGKPHPEPYQMAAERFGVPTAEMLVLEDSGNGCRSGIAAGAFTVAVPNEHTVTHDFDGVSLTVESLADQRLFAALGI